MKFFDKKWKWAAAGLFYGMLLSSGFSLQNAFADVIPPGELGMAPSSVSPLMPSLFSAALIQTLIAELLAALIFVSIVKIPKKILLWVVVGNLISLPMVWFAFPLLPFPGLIILALSEIFAVASEAYLIYFMSKKTISLKKSLFLSFLMNLASFLFPPPLY